MERDGLGRFIKGTNGNTFEGYGVWYTKRGYPCIWYNNRSTLIHVFVWERANGKKPQGFHIHHIDEDKTNYDLSNLMLVSPYDHQRIHAGWKLQKDGSWLKPCKTCKKHLPLEDFHPRKGLAPLNHCKKCSSENHKKKLKDNPEYREKKRLYLKEYYKRKRESILKQQRDARKTKQQG